MCLNIGKICSHYIARYDYLGSIDTLTTFYLLSGRIRVFRIYNFPVLYE